MASCFSSKGLSRAGLCTPGICAANSVFSFDPPRWSSVHVPKARWRAWLYPEGARELEEMFEIEFGQAALRVAYAFIFEEVCLQ